MEIGRRAAETARRVRSRTSGARGNYAGTLVFDKNGGTTIDFNQVKGDKMFKDKNGNFDNQKFEDYKNAAENDKGFQLVSNLIKASESFYYGTENHGDLQYKDPTDLGWRTARFQIPLKKGQTLDYSNFPNVGDFVKQFSSNLSKSDDQLGGRQYRPVNYNGAVNLVPASYFLDNKPLIKIPRVSVVFHELQENYLRTHFGYGWQDAHDLSNTSEEHTYGNPAPGVVQKVKGE